MQAFQNKIECGRAMLQWTGNEDPVAAVARAFVKDKDVNSIDQLESAAKTIGAIRYAPSVIVDDECRADLERIEKFLEQYISQRKQPAKRKS